MRIVVEAAPFHEGVELRREGGDLVADDELGEVEGMGADVADRAGGAGAGRIRAPFGLLAAGLLDAGGEPILRVFHLHDADGPELARLHHGARLPHQGIAGVIVRDREDQAGFTGELRELIGLAPRGRQRLVADHMDAGLQEGAGGCGMGVVRRDDGDRVDAVLQPPLAARHLVEIAIDAIRLEEQILAGGLGPLRVGGEGARHKLPAVVETGRDAVHRADEGAAPAADHAEAQAAVQLLVRRSCNRHVSPLVAYASMPSMRRLAASSVPPAAKSSKAFSVTRMMLALMNSAPSRAPSSGCLSAHSHSSTAQES